MGEKTGIAWTDHTFSPWWGCVRVSPGCENCYAETNDARWFPGDEHWGPRASRRFFGDKHWNEPHRWNQKAKRTGVRRRVFCSPMSDVFERRLGLESDRERLWKTIEQTRGLDWLVLTKRPENALEMLPWTIGNAHDTCVLDVCKAAILDGVVCPPDSCDIADKQRAFEPWRHVWLGTTGENHEWAVKRADILRTIPAAVRFISYEPALGPVDWDRVLGPGGIDWVIVGGESGFGGKVREFKVEWAEQAMAACRKYGAAFFMKQLGRFPRRDGQLVQLRIDRRAGAAFEEIPAHLQAREFPVARTA